MNSEQKRRGDSRRPLQRRGSDNRRDNRPGRRKDRRDDRNKPARWDPDKLLADLDTSPRWLTGLTGNPLPRLLHKERPSTTLFVLKTIYGLDHNDRRYREIESRVFSQHSWKIVYPGKIAKMPVIPDDDRSRGMAFLDQLERMQRILDLGGSQYLPPVKNDIVNLMKFQQDDGRFPMLYHHHAHATWLLLQLGMQGSRFVDRAIHWILERQRPDGGWLHRSMAAGSQYDKAPSCIWTTAEVLQLLTSRSSTVQLEKTRNACEFMLNNVLKKNTTNFFPSEDAWNHLAISHKGEAMFGGGSLKVLESAVRCGYNHQDKRVDKMINWLKSRQLENGFFPRVAGKLPIADGMVTARALFVMKNLAKSSKP